MNIVVEPVLPWSLPTLGPTAMLIVAVALAVLTLWTYLGVKQATWRRILIVLSFRLTALALVFGMMLRPSLATTQLEGLEVSKLLVIFDASKSMNAVDFEGRPSRWEQLNKLWAAPEVQRRLKALAAEQRIEVVKYLGDEDLRADSPLTPDPSPPEGRSEAKGKRTDIGTWLHQLRIKYGQDKHLRGILLFSDGADNGTRFSAQEKARAWRGIAPVFTFGVGDPGNTKYKKDIGLSSLDVKTAPVSVQSEMEIEAVVQSPGYEKPKVEIRVWLEGVADNKIYPFKEMKDFELKAGKDQHITIKGVAPEKPGEYKLSLKITPHPEESNKENNEISTYVTVIKNKIQVLWVDSFRVWEPTYAIRALASEQRFDVHHVIVPVKNTIDAYKLYEFDRRAYDVIVIGDVSAKEFCSGNPKILDTIQDHVENKNKGTGLLILGGSQTFCKGGWKAFPRFMSMLPVAFDANGEKADFSDVPLSVMPTKDGLQHPFLDLAPSEKQREDFWIGTFNKLLGHSPTGQKAKDAVELLKGLGGELVMVSTVAKSGGRVVVFGADSTHLAWRDNVEAIRAYNRFWKNLVFWLAHQREDANKVWIKLDRRRINTEAGEMLGFTFGLKGKSGAELPRPTFQAEVVKVGSEGKRPVQFVAEKDHQKGTFPRAGKVGDWPEPGEYQLVVKGSAKDGGVEVNADESARFLVVSEDIEMLRPAADHETLMKIAANAEGHFSLAQEQDLLRYLDELRGAVTREARQKTVHWPDWNRVPASESARDQLPALWHSFALFNLLLFVALLGAEWGLRRWWGLV